ncbi:hypothetical protein FQR65_LT20077 [Abscondita terminalis]|nr:hypothetical protein FQR65_LT20077 [Abscondita terminalis]
MPEADAIVRVNVGDVVKAPASTCQPEWKAESPKRLMQRTTQERRVPLETRHTGTEYATDQPVSDHRANRQGQGRSSESIAGSAGMALITAANGTQVKGKVRMIAPTVDAQNRAALVYVDLAPTAADVAPVRAGMFATGQFDLGNSTAVTVPQPDHRDT